jgi:hypothetical protein
MSIHLACLRVGRAASLNGSARAFYQGPMDINNRFGHRARSFVKWALNDLITPEALIDQHSTFPFFASLLTEDLALRWRQPSAIQRTWFCATLGCQWAGNDMGHIQCSGAAGHSTDHHRGSDSERCRQRSWPHCVFASKAIDGAGHKRTCIPTRHQPRPQKTSGDGRHQQPHRRAAPMYSLRSEAYAGRRSSDSEQAIPFGQSTARRSARNGAQVGPHEARPAPCKLAEVIGLKKSFRFNAF